MNDGWVSVSDCGWVSVSDCDCGIVACYAYGLALAQLGLQFRHIQPLLYPQGIFLIIFVSPLAVIDLGAEVLV